MGTQAVVRKVSSIPSQRTGVIGQTLEGHHLFFFSMILLISFALRTLNLGEADLWTDEVITSMRASVGITESLESMLTAGNQVPLYYLIMRVVPNEPEFFLRLPSAILGVVNVALLGYVVSEVHNPDTGLWAAALLGVNPLHVELSRTARFYTLLLLLSLIAAYAFLRILNDRHSRRDWWLLGISSTLAYLTHYTALAILAAQFLILLLVSGYKSTKLRTLILNQSIAALPLIVWVGIMTSYLVVGSYSRIPHLPAIKDMPLTYLYILTGDDGISALSVIPSFIAVGSALTIGAFALLSQSEHKASYCFWFALAVISVIMLFVLSLTAGIRYQDRYFTVAIPGIILVFLLGCSKLPRLSGLLVVSIVFLTGAYQSVQQSVVGNSSRTDWTGASAYVEEHFQATDRLVFQRWTTRTAFTDHLPDDSSVASDTVLFEELPDGFNLEVEGQRVWVIYRAPHQYFHAQEWISDFDPLVPRLSSLSDWLIEHQSQIVEAKRFKGVTVLLLSDH